MGQVITSVEQITPGWISTVLNIPETAITDIRTEVIHSHPGTNKWRIHVTYNGNMPAGTPPTLFLKSGEETHRDTGPHEARFYQAVREDSDGLAVVPCYDVVIDGNWSHILLKDLSDTHNTSPPTQLPPLNADCERIIDGLADLHAFWWDHSKLETIFGGKPSEAHLRGWYAEDVAVYARFTDYLGDRLPDHRRAIIKQVGEKLPDLMVERYAQDNLTLTFEDVHAGNFLYPRNPDDTLYFIDWEQWGINLAMNDLAYMMAMFWSPERRSRLEVPYLKRYHERIQTRGVLDYSWDALWYDYRLCVMKTLFVPAWNWQHNGPPDVWWNHLERIFVAYEDLNCVELLD